MFSKALGLSHPKMRLYPNVQKLFVLKYGGVAKSANAAWLFTLTCIFADGDLSELLARTRTADQQSLSKPVEHENQSPLFQSQPET